MNVQINYFEWAIFNSYVKLPEGNSNKKLYIMATMGIAIVTIVM